MNSNEDLLRYPVGRFAPKETYSTEERAAMIALVLDLHQKMESTVGTFTEALWNTPYREGGWTARQVVHHIADSHLNAYIRIKWTLTEDGPLIKAYNEKLWAQTPEVSLDPSLSLNLLKGLQAKLGALFQSLGSAELQRYFIHPDTQKKYSLERMIALYSWHGEHHLGHLKIIKGKT